MTPPAISARLRRSQPVSGIPHRLDGRIRAELLPQPAHADVDDVRARIEVVAPDFGEQPLPAHDLTDVDEQVMQEPELAVGEVRGPLADTRLAARDVENDAAAAQDVFVTEARRAA